MGKRLLVFGVLVITAGIAVLAGGQHFDLTPTAANAASLPCDHETDTLCTISSQKIITMAPGGSETMTIDKSLLITDGGVIQAWIPDKGEARTLNIVVAGSITLTGDGAINGNATKGDRIGATLNITANGKIDLQDSSSISATTFSDCMADGHAGNINLKSTYTSSGADDAAISMASQTTVTAGAVQDDDQTNPSCPAGDINFSAPNGDISIAGRVESAIPSGATDVQRLEDGGAITVDAGCKLDVSGLVSSRGRDNGSDLVHLEGGCSVDISGAVESTGPGNVPLAHNSCHGDDRPAKPAASTSCVEVVSGGELTITGSVNADLCCYGGSIGDSWIDLYAAGDISLDGTTEWAVHANGNGGQYDSGGAVTIVSTGGSVSVAEKGVSADGVENGGSILIEAARDVSITGGSVYAVHADGDSSNYDGGSGGNVTVRAHDGSLTAEGEAVSASAYGNRAAGGSINLESRGAMTLDKSTLLAAGDANSDADYGKGGTISVRSVGDNLSWTPSGLADVRPSGTEVDVGSEGAIFLTYCKGIDTTGVTFPTNGSADDHFPTVKSDCITDDMGEITVPDNIVLPSPPDSSSAPQQGP